jgi:tetratricopeptide (TPR) repeat protein
MAGTALEQGDYTTAIIKSLEALEKDPDLEEANVLLKDAWQQANNEWSAQITTIEQATTADQLYEAIPLYNKLLEIHKIVQQANRNDLKPNREEILEKALVTQSRIATLYVEEGTLLLEQGGRANGRNAVQKLTRAKDLDPKFTGIDILIEKATEEATVKVFVFTGPDKNNAFNGIDMIPMVEQKLSALPFVEVVVPPNRYAAPIGDDHNAKDFARGHGADIMIHFEPATTISLSTEKDVRPISSSVTAAPDWEIEKLYKLASGTCEISYLVIDLETEEVLDEGTFTVKDSTDFGFSVSAIRHNGEVINAQIGNMAKSEKLLKNNLAPGKSLYTLSAELYLYEKIKEDFSRGMSPARYGTFEEIDFNDYETPDQLAKIVDLNGHVFALFDVVEMVSESSEYPNYGTLYGQYFGDGFEGSVKTAQFDRQVYNKLVNWISGIKSSEATRKAYSSKFYTTIVPAKIAAQVSSALK